MFQRLPAGAHQPAHICVNVDVEKWDTESEKVFELLINCLSRLRLSHGIIMTAFFFFKFPEAKSGLFSMFSKPKPGPAEGFIERMQGDSSTRSAAGEAGAMIMCLPELRPVRHEDVDEWANLTVPDVCNFLDPDVLAQRVSNLFAEQTERRYKDIIVPLKEALKSAAT